MRGRYLTTYPKAEQALRLVVVTSLLLGGCATRLPPVDNEQQALDAYDRVKGIIQQQEPVTGPIGLYEAMARALKYNLDQKIEEYALAYETLQLETVEQGMLPALSANYSRYGRNNDMGSRSTSLSNGSESEVFSTSSEKNGYNADLTASWNLLDFGFAYLQSKQAFDEKLIAEQTRRKVINRILEDVRTSYWRAVSAERTQEQLLSLEAEASRALLQAETLEIRGKVSPITVMNYQRELLDIQANIQKMQRELMLAKNQLAALINLPPELHFNLQLPERSEVVPELPGSARQMVMVGLVYRSELRESWLRRRINETEQDLALVRALPSFNAVFGLNYDSNEYLFNNRWQSYSANVSWDLMSLFRYPAQKKAAIAEGELIQAREDALVMAVMTQIHVARARFIRMSQELDTIRRKYEVQKRITSLIRAQAESRLIGQRDLVKEYMSSILTEVQYDAAFADLQNAYANLYASMGLDNLDINIDASVGVYELSQLLEEHWTERAITLPAPPVRSKTANEAPVQRPTPSNIPVGGPFS